MSEPVKFLNDIDRHAWRVYMAASMNVVTSVDHDLVPKNPTAEQVRAGFMAECARWADGALAEERKRR